MRRLFVRTVTLIVAAAVAAPAFAELPARLDNESFVKAAACAAYGSLRSLAQDGVDVSAVVARVNADMPNKMRDVQKRASRQVRTALAAEYQGTSLDELRERRDRACTAFLTPGAQAGVQ
jgi:hypothetical protein